MDASRHNSDTAAANLVAAEFYAERVQRVHEILDRLKTLSKRSEQKAEEYWQVKDELDEYIQEVLAMRTEERPTGDQLAEAVGLTRWRIYQIRKLSADRPRPLPKRPRS